MRPMCQWSLEGHVLEAARNEAPRQWVEREERIGVTWELCFTGRVLSEDRDSLFRNMRYREQAGMMPAPVCLLELQEL